MVVVGGGGYLSSNESPCSISYTEKIETLSPRGVLRVLIFSPDRPLPAPAVNLFVDADYRPSQKHPVLAPHGHAAVPPGADEDMVCSAEAVEEGAGQG